MKKWITKKNKEILIALAIVFFAVLVCCVMILTGNYSTGLNKQAEDTARLYATEFGDMLNDTLDRFVREATSIASGLPSERVKTAEYLNNNSKESIAFFRLFKDGKELDSNGFEFKEIESPHILNAAATKAVTVTGLVSDSATRSRGFAVYVPAPAGASADGIVVFYYIGALENEFSHVFKSEASPKYLGVCSTDGVIFSTLLNDDFPLSQYENLYDKLRKVINDKQAVDDLERSVSENGALTVTINGERYIICLNGGRAAQNELYTVAIYKSADVYRSGFQLVDAVYAGVIVLSLIVVVIIAIIITMRFRAINQLDEAESYDPVLGCPSYKKLAADTESLLAKNRITKYAVVYAEIAHFRYFEDNFGEEASGAVLEFLAKLFAKSLLQEEAYGYLGKNEFALVFHYGKENSVYDRLKVLNTIVYNCPQALERGFNLKLNIGVYFIEREKNYSIQKIVDGARLALKSGNEVQGRNIKVYNSKIREMVSKEAEIESIMEASLKNGEFKVFYQPKYNIEYDHPDGSEALVRWYDPKKNRFRSPDEFVPLFETNGFIAQVDRYVITEVCKYLRESMDRGYKVVPVSVNASRVSAIQPDFISFYAGIRKKYGIADGFLTIEFTESFAYENYDILKNLVTELHQNGYKCSIDDFGSGYSSFEVLKKLPMDELKLDKIFIQHGISQERDDSLLSTIITLGKSLGMKTTQEGVEDPEDFEKLKRFGCDVIQGYIYSKPLPMTDYISFLNEKHYQGLKK